VTGDITCQNKTSAQSLLIRGVRKNMSKRAELFEQALDEDRALRQTISELKLIISLAKEEVAERISHGDFIRYQRLQNIFI